MTISTSDKGVTFLERHEGTVTKAYLCPANRWTIWTGLTAASGVVKPHAGMVISPEEGSRLLKLALARNYEPRVRKVMGDLGPAQHEFDAGVSFDFNTGAIHKASWVPHWMKANWPEVKRRLAMWNKGGGRVLPGLARRRAEEYKLMRWGQYGAAPVSRPSRFAAELVEIGPDQRDAIRKLLVSLGYDPGNEPEGFAKPAVTAFQRDHDLVVDGKIGRATLSALQRRLDAARKTQAATAAGAVGAIEAEAGLRDQIALTAIPDWALWALTGLAALYLARLTWSYRDVLAAKVQRRFPEIAAKLRSF